MSLNFTKGKIIANVFNNDNEKTKTIHYNEDAKGEKIEKMRLPDNEGYFFPELENWTKTEQVDRVYVTGETGTGKSSFIKSYVQHFMIKFPKSPILLFSSKKEDKALDNIKRISRVEVDDDIYINPYTLEEISSKGKPVLVIFDDIEDFPNKKINKEVERLRDETLRNGRSYGIYSIFVHHNPCDYKSTRNQIFEANKVVIFPKRSGKGTYNYLMEKKLLLDKETIGYINDLKSNFVCINKVCPKTIISDKYILVV